MTGADIEKDGGKKDTLTRRERGWNLYRLNFNQCLVVRQMTRPKTRRWVPSPASSQFRQSREQWSAGRRTRGVMVAVQVQVVSPSILGGTRLA